VPDGGFFAAAGGEATASVDPATTLDNRTSAMRAVRTTVTRRIDMTILLQRDHIYIIVFDRFWPTRTALLR
jgi:hypothetical protein